MSLNYNTRSNGTGLHGTGRGRKGKEMKYRNMRWRIPMNNLQLFAEGEGDGSGAGNGNEDGAGAGSGDSGNEMSFDDFLGQAENRAEFDRRVQKAVNTAVTKAQEKWRALTDDKLSEAEKLAKMTKEEKAEYKNRKLEKELADLKRQNALSEMSKTARKMLTDEEINIPDELLTHLVSESAEDTKTAVETFAKMYKDAVQAAVKDALKGNAPKGGSGGKGAVTKEQILAVSNPIERQRLIAENIALFQ
jgi:hypothetical protein